MEFIGENGGELGVWLQKRVLKSDEITQTDYDCGPPEFIPRNTFNGGADHKQWDNPIPHTSGSSARPPKP